ncbi:MAG: hypothetical protein QOC65_1423, partial [Sphingomonadales bacterium]|nr:hypothetical protein [Sphingomonadales bacterium]
MAGAAAGKGSRKGGASGALLVLAVVALALASAGLLFW